MEWYRDIEFVGALASIVGVLIGVPALVIAFLQLRRTERAAEAAAASAKDAVRRLSSIVAVASLERTCSRSRDLLHLMRARNLTASATAAFELREALAKFIKSSIAMQLLQESEWSNLLKSVAGVHDVLERAAAIRKIDAGSRDQILHCVSNVHSQLSMLATVAGEKAGGINADSR
jgi:hypothetical protein